MSATINTFPPLQSMNSPRGWALAIIVLLHLGLFWALMSGMGTRIMTVLKQPPTQVVDVAPVKPTERVMKPTDATVDMGHIDPLVVPEPSHVIYDADEPTGITGPIVSEPPAQPGETSGDSNAAVVLPQIDPRMPLSEPQYPPTEIRMNHAGTVLLGVYVLENGRVGDVRIEQSSGFQRLDIAAQRAAYRWRLKPGARDGRPVAMWKTVPITFQLRK